MGVTTAGAGRKRLVAVLAGAAMLGSVAAAAPASAGDAEAAAATISITVSGKTKPASGCQYIVWTLNVSGMADPSNFSISTKVVKSGEDAVTGSLVDGYDSLKNGANRVRGYICSSTDPAGVYKALASLKKNGQVVKSAKSVNFGLRVKPKVEFSGVGGRPGIDGYITGYAQPAVDVKGKTVSLFFKKKGASSYSYLGTKTFDKNGFFKLTSSKINAGWIYASVKQQGFVLASKTKPLELVVKSSSASLGTVQAIG